MNNKEILIEGLKKWDIEITDEKCSQFEIYKDLLLEWNKVMNLTAIEDEREVYIKHFLDSISCIITGKINKDLSVIDVGTGAGFPSMPLKIMVPEIKLTLLDSLNKRLNFLRDVSEKAELDGIEYFHSRAEDGGQNKAYREKFDIAVSRAVASLPVLLEYCLPFVKEGGYLICQKGPALDDEIRDAKRSLEVLGGEIEEIIKVDLPFTELDHRIAIIKKVKKTPKQYPRKAGKPSKEPIK